MKLYAWDTPNGQKPVLLLEELGIEYEIVPVDIRKAEQDEAAFRRINPNGKIPAFEDGDVTIFESGAILLHLADRYGQFLSRSPAERNAALSWVFWQVGGLGPMAGQWGHFTRRDERNPYAEQRYRDEMMRLLGVLETGLRDDGWLAGGAYSIADMMSWPWVRAIFDIFAAQNDNLIGVYPAVTTWCDAIGQRNATKRGLEKLKRASTS